MTNIDDSLPQDIIDDAIKSAWLIAWGETPVDNEYRFKLSNIQHFLFLREARLLANQTQANSIDYHVISDSYDGLVAMSSAVAGQLIGIKNALKDGNYDDAELYLIAIADPNLTAINTWEKLESIANMPNPKSNPVEKETTALQFDVNKMVDRFLGYKLPADFSPDAGISFSKRYNVGTAFERDHEPTGTKLLNAEQAKAMFEYCVNYQSDFNLDYTAKRIRRLLRALDIPDPSGGNDNTLMGCLFSLLGIVCRKLEIAPPNSTQQIENARNDEQKAVNEAYEKDANRWNAFVNLWLMCTELKVTQNEDGGYSIIPVEFVDSEIFSDLDGDTPDDAIDKALIQTDEVKHG